MFDIGFIEILIVSMVALIVIGPERLPRVARTLGHLLGRARRYVSGVKNDIENELKIEELNNLRASVHETASSIKESMKQEVDEIKSMTEMSSSTTTESKPTEAQQTDASAQVTPSIITTTPDSKSAAQQIDITKKDIP